MRKAFAYLRASGKGRGGSNSFPRQLAAIKGYAMARHIAIAHVYAEKEICGAGYWEFRPAWMEMMAATLGNGVETVLVEKVDRLADSLMMQETLIGDLRKRGLQVISVREPDLLQDDPTRSLLRGMMGEIAEHEKALLVLKVQGERSRVQAAARLGAPRRSLRLAARGGASTIRRCGYLMAAGPNTTLAVVARGSRIAS
jgi:DNA invertase Pin-like site-specific DNA recombinase